VNLIAKDWRRLARFYQDVFGCEPVPPERDLKGAWLEQATGIKGAEIAGIHLRLPEYGEDGPVLEVFQYGTMPEHPSVRPNTPGFGHIAFAVEDVASTARAVLAAGGAEVGALTVCDIPGVGVITFQYMADPEGNVVEIQCWVSNPGVE
jgi:predicted enzyme related to lactoylglutathione lyase